ncbi:hypothetical protein SSX86_012056 [Deinandra increscens subsp. villosa]|uniref:Uncharacterized protein n=1 Tax=Deinandra increscens subsp. villosa TaxID=3103831 RepID=A0AAP0D3H2_9ASTR
MEFFKLSSPYYHSDNQKSTSGTRYSDTKIDHFIVDDLLDFPTDDIECGPFVADTSADSSTAVGSSNSSSRCGGTKPSRLPGDDDSRSFADNQFSSLYTPQIKPLRESPPQKVPFTAATTADRSRYGSSASDEENSADQIDYETCSALGAATQTQATLAKPVANDVPSAFFSRSTSSEKSLGGKASLQPKRTPMTQEEIDAILVGKPHVNGEKPQAGNIDDARLMPLNSTFV